MQTNKTSNSGLPDGPQKSSPSTPKQNRLNKAVVLESDSMNQRRSPKVIQRSSSRSPVTEKNHPSCAAEFECQLTQLQKDLKRAKDELNISDSLKRQAQQEAAEAKQQLSVLYARFEDSQRHNLELSESEDDRIHQLRKISQDRDRAWQSELEAVQNQRSVDSAALNSAMNEIQRFRMQLEIVITSEAAQAKQSEAACSELKAVEQKLAETLSVVENLKIQLRESEQGAAKALSTLHETQHQLEIAKTTAETLHSDGLKLKESLSCVSSELEKSRAQENLLKETINKSQADKLTFANSLVSEIEQLRSELEAAEVKFEEELIKNMVQIQSAYELVEQLRSECRVYKVDLKSALKDAELEIAELKAKLCDKETHLQGISGLNERLNLEIREQVNQLESNLGVKLTQSIAEIIELKEKIMDKDAELKSILEENELLKSEAEKKEVENCKRFEAAIIEVKANEQKLVSQVSFLNEEADKSSRRAMMVTEQLDAVQAVKLEMEEELRKLRVQSDQWRKAAEAAAALITAGKDGRFVERSACLGTDYSTIGGKLLSSPFSDDMDEESPKKTNINVLRMIGGMWKKGQKYT